MITPSRPPAIGTMLQCSPGSYPPPGWLLTLGQTILVAEYQDLYAVLVPEPEEGQETFKLPKANDGSGNPLIIYTGEAITPRTTGNAVPKPPPPVIPEFPVPPTSPI
jgi:microcystin-dependent protein